MKKIFISKIFFTSLLILLLCACSAKDYKPGPFKVNEAVLSKAIEDRGNRAVPVSPASTYSAEDKAIYALITYSDLAGTHHLRWEWFDPKGNLYAATSDFPVHASPDTFVKEGSACHNISIKDAKSALIPGKWKVDMYLDDMLVASRPFEITNPVVTKKKPFMSAKNRR